MARFPSLYRRLAALVLARLDPGSRLRRVFLRRNVISAYAAFTRQDFDPILVRFAPDVVYEFNPGLQTIGLGGTFRGHEGMLEAFSRLAEAWESWELEPAYILDLGDRVLSLGFWRSRARASGVPLEVDYAELATAAEGGFLTHHQDFFSWEEGLRAAGLDPDAIALPSPPPAAPSRPTSPPDVGMRLCACEGGYWPATGGPDSTEPGWLHDLVFPRRT